MKTAKIYQTPCVEVLEIVASMSAMTNLSATGTGLLGTDPDNTPINNGTEIL